MPFVTSVSEFRDIRHDKLMRSQLQDECKNWIPDVVWERSSRLHCAGESIARRYNVPYVLEWKDHLVDYRFSLFRSYALRLEARKCRIADYIVVESEVLRATLERDGIDPGKILVAHNAVRTDEFSRSSDWREKFRNRLSVDADTVLVGYLGSYAFYHDTQRLVLAANLVRKKEGQKKIRILMMGAGKEYSDCRRLAEELGLLDDMLILEPGVPKQEVPEVLAALDIAVLPGSTDIICPIKVQEYMAAELPVVIPDYACNREVVEGGRTGSLFAPGDEEALAGEICALAENAEIRRKFGTAARREMQRRFTWEETWGSALQRILTKSSRPGEARSADEKSGR